MDAGRPERVILHLDMDAFFAAVEVRENPELAGREVIVGHRGRRGVVTTCSYEARRFGVRSAMPSVTAERLCPQAIWLPGRMDLYVSVSRAIRKILEEAAPVVEPLSIDEAFLDLTGLASDLEAGRIAAAAIKERIRAEQRLTASVGVAPNKFLAKLASDLEKPDGLVVFPMEDVPARLWPLPVQRLWGVGPRTAERLATGGITHVGDLLHVPEKSLVWLVGPSAAAHLRELAQGRDDRRVSREREARSLSEERTYGTDLTDPDDIDRAFLARAEGVARELRRQGLAGRTVHIKVRTGDFTTWTRAHTLARPTDLAEPILETARRLFRERIPLAGRGVRLLGVGVSGLEPADEVPKGLFDEDLERAGRLARAADEVRHRLGKGALTRASLLRTGAEETRNLSEHPHSLAPGSPGAKEGARPEDAGPREGAGGTRAGRAVRGPSYGRITAGEEAHMADTQSFDVTTGCDLQEVDNAVNQTRKELGQRYDFKDVKFTIEFRRDENQLVLTGPDDFKLKAVWEVLQSKMVRRGVPLRNLKQGKIEPAAGNTVRQQIDLQQGIPIETARSIVKFIKDQKLKKVQAAIQGDQVRISSPSRDELQSVIGMLKQQDFGVELKFGNYR